MTIEPLTKTDFDEIIRDIADFWGSDRTLQLHNPTLINEFGNTAYVIRDGGRVAAYFFGFYSQTEPVAYGNLVGVRKSYQRHGHGMRLWNHFIAAARKHGCREIKCITSTAKGL